MDIVRLPVLSGRLRLVLSLPAGLALLPVNITVLLILGNSALLANSLLAPQIGQKLYVWGIKFTPSEIPVGYISNGVDYYRLKAIALGPIGARARH
jgi:hypothetical protein